MPRVPPITGKGDVPAEFHPVVDDVLSVFGQIRGPFSMLLHSPPLAERMLQFVKFNRGGTIVEPRLLSHAILASVRERDADYVWAAQVNAARRAGVPEPTIDLLRAEETWRVRPVRCGEVAGPQIVGLHHVEVAVEDQITGACHVSPPNCATHSRHHRA